MKKLLSYSYFYLLFILLAIYGFNKFAWIGNIKIFYLLIPPILLLYIYRYKYIFSYELKIMSLFILLLFSSTINTFFFFTDSLGSVLFSNMRILLIFLILIPIATFYKHRGRHFNYLLIIIIIEVVVSNFIYYIYYYDFSDRFQGTFGGSNEFAYMLMFYIYIIYYFLHSYPKTKLKLLLYTLLIGLHILIIITLSRSAMLAMIIFYFFAFPYFVKKLKFWQKSLLLIITSILIYISLDFFSHTIELASIRFSGDEGSSSLNSRFYEMLAGINLLNDHPVSLLLGNGTGITGTEIFKEFYSGISHGLGTRVHNTFFAIIVENGVISFTIFLYMLFIIVKKAYVQKDLFKYVIIAFVISTSAFMSFIYLLYFLPLWLGMIMIVMHTRELQNKELHL